MSLSNVFKLNKKTDFGVLNACWRNNWQKIYFDLSKGEQFKDFYHYTDLTAFKSIVENKSLWMSNPKYLNDSKEFIEAKDKVIEFIDCYISRNKKISSDFIKILKEVKIQLVQNDSFDKEFFISSFSTNSDDLSQWRAYGRNGEGVCFKLKNFGLKQFIHLYKVIYKPADKYKIIHHILYKYSYWFHKEKTDYYYNDYVESLIRHFSQLFPIFKDEAFESENEIRLVFDRDYYPSYDKVIKKHYRVSNNFLLPYIETSDLSFDDIKKPMIDIEILKVILGPTTKHKELTKQSIEDFLQEKGFSDTKVEFSKLPYR